MAGYWGLQVSRCPDLDSSLQSDGSSFRCVNIFLDPTSHPWHTTMLRLYRSLVNEEECSMLHNAGARGILAKASEMLSLVKASETVSSGKHSRQELKGDVRLWWWGDPYLGFASGVLQMGHFPLFRFRSIPGIRTMHLLFVHLKNEPVASVSSSFLRVSKKSLLWANGNKK